LGDLEVFNEMFEAGKGSKCLASDARISVNNWNKNTLNDCIRKLDKTKGLRPGSPKRSAHDLLETDLLGPDEELFWKNILQLHRKCNLIFTLKLKEHFSEMN